MRLEPIGGAGQRCGLEPDGSGLPFPALGDHSGSFEHLDVFRHGLERDREQGREVVHGRVPIAETLDDHPPDRIPESRERDRQILLHRRSVTQPFG